MLKVLKNAFKVKEIRQRIFFTFFILFVFRIGSYITVPGVNASAIQSLANNTFFNIFNMVSGSAMQNFSLFAMGVSPYITASIVIQLLQMDIVPKFVEWGKQGEVGRRKLTQATRYLTLVLAFIQSVGITAGFHMYSQYGLVKDPGMLTFIVIGIILTAGVMLLTWMGELITERGIGNGVSMIIFAGIVSKIPSGLKQLYHEYFVNVPKAQWGKSFLFIGLLLVCTLIVVGIVTFFQQAERQIPIQYTKRVSGAPSSSYLPLKVNAAGVIPVIFASSLLATPSAILQLFQHKWGGSAWYDTIMTICNYQTLPGCTLYLILIVAFTFFYALVQVNPEKLAENLQKQGSYIPRVRPGRGTEEYISHLIIRLSTVGSIFLAAVAVLPIIAQAVWNLPSSIGLGGTSLLIMIGVALEFVKQLEGLLLKRQYIGFINK